MQRLMDQRERGATAVMFALLLTVLLGFTGLAVDMGANYAKRQELQNGADAGALAAAQSCARTGCGTAATQAQNLAAANVRNQSNTVVAQTQITGNRVRVEASGEQEHWFMPVLGIDSSTVSAEATVEWGSPIRGRVVLPVTFSLCSFENQLGQPDINVVKVISIVQPGTGGNTSVCHHNPGMPVAGGFGWLAGSGCTADVRLGSWVGGDTGNSPPGGCSDSSFNAWVGQVVLLPVYDQTRGTGSNAEYRISRFAAFELLGFRLRQGGSGGIGCPGGNGTATCLQGRFLEYVSVDPSFEIGPAPDSDLTIIRLTS